MSGGHETGAADQKPVDAQELVGSILRKLDPDHYFASLLLPTPAQPKVQAIWAFAAEIAAVRQRVSEPGPGEIRLQWWRDAIEGRPHGDVTANPVAAALLATVEQHGLATPPLTRLIAARRFDLYQDPMPDMASFEGYAGETVSVLYQYGAQILHKDGQQLPGDAAGHLGVAVALIGHVRAFGFNAAAGRIFLPLDRFLAAGIAEKDILAGQREGEVAEVIGQFVHAAGEHLDAASAALQSIPREVRPAFVSLGLARARLKRMKAKTPAPYARAPDLPDWRKLATMFIWGLRNA